MTEGFNAEALTKALQAQPETVTAPGVIKAVFQISDVKEDFKKLYEITGEETLLGAIEAGHFVNRGREFQDRLYTSITLYRCWMQGSLEPPTDLPKLYTEAKNEVDLKNGTGTGTSTTGNKI